MIWRKDENDFYLRWDHVKRIELPLPFSVMRCRAFYAGHISLRSQSWHSWRWWYYSLYKELVRILPTRLNNAAFLLWDSLSAIVQAGCERKIQRAFWAETSPSARPCALWESLEAYASEMVDKAFPHMVIMLKELKKINKSLFPDRSGSCAMNRGWQIGSRLW